MKKNVLPILVTIIFLTIGIIPIYAFDQYESMKVGETKTFYFPSEVTSRAGSMYAYNCTSDHINNVEVVSYTKTSVTVKALSYTQYTVNIRFDYWWYENGYGRTDTHMVHIDLYESGGGGGGNTDGNENPGDYFHNDGCWGTINIYEDESTTVYCQYDTPNPDKVISIVWSHYGSVGYEITSQSSYSCTIKGSFVTNDQKLWCLMKYGNTSYKAYYIVNILKDTKETLTLTANPNGGTVEEGTIVKLSSSVSGANIYYTLDGTTPTTNSLMYNSSGIPINESCTLKAFARKSGYNDSPVMTWVFTVKEGNKIEINATNFPDENFRKYLLSQSYGSDGKLSTAEINNIKEIDVSGSSSNNGNIISLKGIEFFTALETLKCNYNNLSSIDVSKNTSLTYLACIKNQLTTLEFSKNTELWSLYCQHNQLTNLDVSKNTKLRDLYCYSNQLTTLNVSKNTELRNLHCDSNQLTTLDVSKNTKLSDLHCYSNQLTTLDVSKNTALWYLQCQSNQLTTLDVSKNTELRDLKCHSNKLTTLGVSKNTKLSTLSCSNNQLMSLDVSNNSALEYLYCYCNQIRGTEMDNLINSLHVNTSGKDYLLRVFCTPETNEGNTCTTTQVAVAKNKGWSVQYWNGDSWVDYEGSDPSEIRLPMIDLDLDAPIYNLSGQKLETPQKGINIVNGKKYVAK